MYGGYNDPPPASTSPQQISELDQDITILRVASSKHIRRQLFMRMGRIWRVVLTLTLRVGKEGVVHNMSHDPYVTEITP